MINGARKRKIIECAFTSRNGEMMPVDFLRFVILYSCTVTRLIFMILLSFVKIQIEFLWISKGICVHLYCVKIIMSYHLSSFMNCNPFIMFHVRQKIQKDHEERDCPAKL